MSSVMPLSGIVHQRFIITTRKKFLVTSTKNFKFRQNKTESVIIKLFLNIDNEQ